MSSQGPAGPAGEFSRLRKLKAPIVALLGWSSDELLRLADVLPTGLTHLGLTEDMASQYMYEWNEESVLEGLAVFLSVWRSATPDLQVVEVWLSQGDDRWKDEEVAQLRMMCEEAGVGCVVYWFSGYSYSPAAFEWVRQHPQAPKLTPWELETNRLLLEHLDAQFTLGNYNLLDMSSVPIDPPNW